MSFEPHFASSLPSPQFSVRQATIQAGMVDKMGLRLPLGSQPRATVSPEKEQAASIMPLSFVLQRLNPRQCGREVGERLSLPSPTHKVESLPWVQEAKNIGGLYCHHPSTLVGQKFHARRSKLKRPEATLPT